MTDMSRLRVLFVGNLAARLTRLLETPCNPPSEAKFFRVGLVSCVFRYI
jgi:hypothetical protein